MNISKNTLLAFGAGALLTLITYGTIQKNKLPHLVRKEVRKEVAQHLTGTFTYESALDKETIDALVAQEEFLGEKPTHDMSSKIGFTYKTENIIYKEKFENAPPLGLFHDMLGASYHFEVQEGYGKKPEFSFTIFCHNAGQGDNSVFIRDYDFDGTPDYVSVHDKKNNYTTTIRRNNEGVLEHEANCDEELAKQLFGFSIVEYRTFLQENDILEKIKQYQQAFEFRKIDPGKSEVVRSTR